MKKVIAECKDGASARAICVLGDKLILEETSKVFKKEKELKKGLSIDFIDESVAISTWQNLTKLHLSSTQVCIS